MDNTKKTHKNRLWRHLGKVFLAGTLAAIPLVGTYFVFRFLFDVLDGVFQPVIKFIFGRSLPGAGLVALIILVYLLGLLATNIFGRRLINWLDGVISRAPIIKYVYSGARQAVDSLRGIGNMSFKRVVVVEFPKVGMYSMGFITGKPVDFNGQNKVPVFIPHTPNPMTGFLVLLSPEQIIDTQMTVEEAMKMVLSGGLISPESIGLHVTN